jgi:protein-disulfide isomerase
MGESIEVTYKNFPLDENLNAAIAAECAREQSMYDIYADKLYASPTQDASALKAYAKDLGLNEMQFSDCLDTGKTRPKVIADYQEGVSLGVKGTPTVIINNKAMAGYQSYADLKDMIDFQLA